MKRTISHRKIRVLFQKMETWPLGRQQWQKALWGCSGEGLLGPDSIPPLSAFISVSSHITPDSEQVGGSKPLPHLPSMCGGGTHQPPILS